MASGKEIKNRITSIKNTGKITKAMELISTVKMKKAQENVLSLRPFALAATSILSHLSDSEEVFKKYIDSPDADTILIVLIASQKGLCGGYNVNLFKHTIEYTRQDPSKKYAYITVGKRARDFVLRTGQNLVADYSDEIGDPADMESARKVVRFILDAWQSQKYKEIQIAYNFYESAISQNPKNKQLFPINHEEIAVFLQSLAKKWQEPLKTNEIPPHIEPNPALIAEYILPMIVDSMFYEIILESRASEHAARMVAMKNAKDAAKKKADALTLTYNKARQTAITTEITEIVSGVESMKQ